MKRRGGIVLLVAEGKLSNIVINHLAARFDQLTVLREKPESKWAVLRRRARRVGPSYAFGQACCAAFLKLQAEASKRRVEQICSDYNLLAHPAANVDVRQIEFVNSSSCQGLLRELSPKVVAVFGTRVLTWQTLTAVKAPYLNYHAGVLPDYRGQCSAYWALIDNNREHLGVTIHLVDEGIDTGPILYQAPVCLVPSDNMATYHFRQMAVALPLLVRAIEDALDDRLQPQQVCVRAAHRFPPTLVRYLMNGLRYSVW